MAYQRIIYLNKSNFLKIIKKLIFLPSLLESFELCLIIFIFYFTFNVTFYFVSINFSISIFIYYPKYSKELT